MRLEGGNERQRKMRSAQGVFLFLLPFGRPLGRFAWLSLVPAPSLGLLFPLELTPWFPCSLLSSRYCAVRSSSVCCSDGRGGCPRSWRNRSTSFLAIAYSPSESWLILARRASHSRSRVASARSAWSLSELTSCRHFNRRARSLSSLRRVSGRAFAKREPRTCSSAP